MRIDSFIRSRENAIRMKFYLHIVCEWVFDRLAIESACVWESAPVS